MKLRPLLVISLAVLLGATGLVEGKDLFKASLSGAQEVPPVTTDSSGKLHVLFNDDGTEAVYTLDIRNGVRVTQAHFHCGVRGMNGPVIVFLAGFHGQGWDVNGKWINQATITDSNIVNDACGSTLTEIADAMRRGNVYVNVHTLAVPSGEVRGQLEPDED